ncbi:MAG TPA: hypothetical protein VN612_01025, partial [Acidobacteriaceae bacterium]|nr:hypothetical protein [Acidobacteriaceae bacterium]
MTAAFLTLSFALSVSTLAVRNLYDDEISTLAVVISSPTSILHYAATVDIHPPGMYLLAHAAWLVIPSYRWMNLLPCLVLYAGLAVFLFAITPLFRERRPLLVLLFIATLHPELLLWSNTFRWYSWWTGLALITLAVVLQPQIEMPSLGWARSLAIGILLAALFYLNYITLLFILALATAMLLRYRFVARSELLRHAAAVVAVFGLLIASQLHTMVVAQLHYASAERVRILASAVRLSEGLIASEAYLPWHPLAILVWLFFLALGAYGMVQFAHRTESQYRPPVECSPALRSITVLGVALFVMVVLAGLGNKPRSAIVLLPVLAPVAAIASSRLRIRAQNALLLFLALWSGVGIAHILGRYGLAKATMDDRPEQVVRFLQHDRGSGCAIVATYDMGLAFALREAHLPNVEELSAADGLASQSAALPQTATCTS